MDKDSRAVSEGLFLWSRVIRVVGALVFLGGIFGFIVENMRRQEVEFVPIVVGLFIYLAGLHLRSQAEIIYLLNEKEPPASAPLERFSS